MATTSDIKIEFTQETRELLGRLPERIEVVSEPLTYDKFAPRSYFRDRVLAINGDAAAEARLQRHAREMDRMERAAQTPPGVEFRVNPNRTDGQGGYFSPPKWLNAEFATAPRSGRILAGLIPTFPLPQGVSQVNLPAITTGTKAAPDSDLAPAPSRDVIDAAISSPAAPFAGNSDWPVQELEQSPAGAHLDWVAFKDMRESYDSQLERALFAGAGGQALTGILNLPTGAGAVSSVVYTDVSPTGAKMFAYLGYAAAQLGDARLMPPEVWLMRTARWAFLGTAEDTAGQPLAVPGHVPTPPMPHLLDDNVPTPAAVELGWPIYPDDAIPATLGAGGQDAIVTCRPSDFMLFESEPKTAVMFEPLSGTLQARLQYRGYAAVLWRYPTAIATLTGTGMTVQPNF